MIDSVLSGRVAVITISRQEKANSLRQQDKRALAEEIERWSDDAQAAAIVLTGRGDRAFCAGSDISEMRMFGMADMDDMLIDERAMYLAALTSSKPVVAAVNGYALGAGLILAMCCDYAIASHGAVFGAPELTIGVAAPLEGLLLPYFIGLQRARAMLYMGARLNAEQAVSAGLINDVASSERLVAGAVEVAEKAADLPGNAFSVQKHLLYKLISNGEVEAVIRESHHLTSRQFTEPDPGAAMTRFLHGRGADAEQ